MGAIGENPHATSGERVRLKLDNLETPVVAKISERNDEGLRVKQALPFLQINTRVRDETGRRAFIRSVDISVDGSIPSIVLDLIYEDELSEATRKMSIDDTIPAIHVASGTPIRRDSTIPFGFQGRQPIKLQSGRARDESPDQGNTWAEKSISLPNPDEPLIVVESEKEHRRERETPIFISTGRRDPTDSIDIDLKGLFDDEVDSPFPKELGKHTLKEDETFAARARALATALLSVVR